MGFEVAYMTIIEVNNGNSGARTYKRYGIVTRPSSRRRKAVGLSFGYGSRTSIVVFFEADFISFLSNVANAFASLDSAKWMAPAKSIPF
jgi:hypothetical protein